MERDQIYYVYICVHMQRDKKIDWYGNRDSKINTVCSFLWYHQTKKNTLYKKMYIVPIILLICFIIIFTLYKN